MLDEITSIDQITALIRECFTEWHRYGDVNVTHVDGLMVFNYSNAAQSANRWNWFERVSRGLVFRQEDGKLLARPFDKFWNWGERGRTTDAPITLVTEKLDGSLGIGFRKSGNFIVSTRGTVYSDQARWATEFINTRHRGFTLWAQKGVTYLFEIIYPENRIVVDYGGKMELVLLAARSNASGKYMPYDMISMIGNKFGIPIVERCFYDGVCIEEIIKLADTLDGNHEGWVVDFSDGSKFKVKGREYERVHRIITNASFNSVLAAMAANEYDKLIESIPESLIQEIGEHRKKIKSVAGAIIHLVETSFNEAPKGSRKEFALWVKENASYLAPYMFLRYDGRDYTDLIYRREF